MCVYTCFDCKCMHYIIWGCAPWLLGNRVQFNPSVHWLVSRPLWVELCVPTQPSHTNSNITWTDDGAQPKFWTEDRLLAWSEVLVRHLCLRRSLTIITPQFGPKFSWFHIIDQPSTSEKAPKWVRNTFHNQVPNLEFDRIEMRPCDRCDVTDEAQVMSLYFCDFFWL